MDPISHALWAFIIGKIIASTGVHINIAALVMFAMLPDIVLLPYALISARDFISRKKSILSLGIHADVITKKAYHITHSYVFLALAAMITYYINKELIAPLLLGAGLIHITADIFVHMHGVTIAPFYPLSKYEVHGLINWYMSKTFIIINSILLIAGIVIAIYIR